MGREAPGLSPVLLVRFVKILNLGFFSLKICSLTAKSDLGPAALGETGDMVVVEEEDVILGSGKGPGTPVKEAPTEVVEKVDLGLAANMM